MIGIDHFKAVIDEFDYDIGDKVLIELAKIIHSNVNEFDMVGRLNGDEFLVSILNAIDKLGLFLRFEKSSFNTSALKTKYCCLNLLIVIVVSYAILLSLIFLSVLL